LFYYKKIDLHGLLLDLKTADRLLLLAALTLTFLSYILCFFRWQVLLQATRIDLSTKRIITAFSGGTFFNLFLPSSIGGDVARSIDLARHTKRAKEVVATVLLDRLSGYLGLVILVITSLALGWRQVGNDISILLPVAFIVLINTVLLLILFNKSLYGLINKLLASPEPGGVKEAIKNLLSQIHYFRNHKKVLLKSLVFSLFIQITIPLAFYITACSLGVAKLKVVYFFIFIPIISAITMLPISMGGFGVRESASVFFFAKAGIPESYAAAMGLVNSFFIFIFGAMGGLLYVLTLRHRREQSHTPPLL
jgi:uncharacterized protein (TIRG00374 family)